MTEPAENKIIDTQASYPDKPYKFNSENPHMEIAEPAYALLQTKIKMKAG